MLLTFQARAARAIARVNLHTSREYHHDENVMKARNSRRKAVCLMPGIHEKGAKKNRRHPYPEPALVPLGEKPKV